MITKPKLKSIERKITNDVKHINKAVNDAPLSFIEHITGERFSHGHKMLFGSGAIIAGVSMAHFLHGIVEHYSYFVYISDGIGYALHAIGCEPFFHYFRYKIQSKNKR